VEKAAFFRPRGRRVTGRLKVGALAMPMDIEDSSEGELERRHIEIGTFSIGMYKMVNDPSPSPTIEAGEESSEDELETYQNDMDAVIRHQEVPREMTCKYNMTPNPDLFRLTGGCGNTYKCITCAGLTRSSIMQHWCLGTSEIVTLYQGTRYGSAKPTTVAGKIAFMAKGMASIKRERKKLATIGAVRISRRDAKDILKARDNMENFKVMMMKALDCANFNGLGYVLYHKEDDEVMAWALDQFSTDAITNQLTTRHKAAIVECLMALGIIYQRNGSIDYELEGIMEIVDAIENMIGDSLARMRMELIIAAEKEWQREVRGRRMERSPAR
jgi:hypothetical protein